MGFKHDLIKCVDFTRIAALNTANDDVTNEATHSITAGTLVPAVLMAKSHSYGNGQTLTTHRIRTP